MIASILEYTLHKLPLSPLVFQCINSYFDNSHIYHTGYIISKLD